MCCAKLSRMTPPLALQPTEPLSVVHSMLSGAAIARAVEAGYELGAVAHCQLLRRGFNDVYGLTLADGRRCVARLSALRIRGAPNAAYEAALLAHAKRAGAHVAASWPARDGAVGVTLPTAEGQRLLMVFDHLDGDLPGDNLRDLEATGAGLARFHDAARGYSGPPSRFVLELPHLLHQPLGWLLALDVIDDTLRSELTAVAARLAGRIEAMPGLSRVACHGDCHGGNNFMTEGPGGERIASFFDFDDAGPGYLAYELATFLWTLLTRAPAGLDAPLQARWAHFIAGYRSVRPIPPADFAAVIDFVGVRQFWFMGEFAGRVPEWGTQALPAAWLRKQSEVMTQWEALATPVAGPCGE